MSIVIFSDDTYMAYVPRMFTGGHSERVESNSASKRSDRNWRFDDKYFQYRKSQCFVGADAADVKGSGASVVTACSKTMCLVVKSTRTWTTI